VWHDPAHDEGPAWEETLLSWPFLCAPGRIRTCDTRFRRAVLYPLSYEGVRISWDPVASLADVGRGLGAFRFAQVGGGGRGRLSGGCGWILYDWVGVPGVGHDGVSIGLTGSCGLFRRPPVPPWSADRWR
jgi:hypothetical protein